MSWDFRTDAEYQAKLDWVDRFVSEEIEPLDLVLGDPYDKTDALAMSLLRPLQERVKAEGIWAAHLGPELGGLGFGQVKLALLNEVLGRSRFAPSVFGCQAPDSGNAEILAHYGSDAQKAEYLQPLLDGEITSCYSMTEPHAGADPTLFTTVAVRDGDSWVITGEKWFSSNASLASFFIVMAVTDPDAPPHDRMSMFIVPATNEGIELVRDVHLAGAVDGKSGHGYVRYNGVRVSSDHLLGGEGRAFAIAQTRLGGGRIHHAMRTIAQLKRAFAMMCERALSRDTRDGKLASMGVVQEQIADSWIEMEQFRLLVLHAAWKIDDCNDYRQVRQDIAAVKVAMPKVYQSVVQRSLHLHGALGVSDELPLVSMLIHAEVMGIVDGPTEVHKVTIAKQVLKDYSASSTLFPAYHLPTLRAASRERYAEAFERAGAEF